jgi:hypothetical protein
MLTAELHLHLDPGATRMEAQRLYETSQQCPAGFSSPVVKKEENSNPLPPRYSVTPAGLVQLAP